MYVYICVCNFMAKYLVLNKQLRGYFLKTISPSQTILYLFVLFYHLSVDRFNKSCPPLLACLLVLNFFRNCLDRLSPYLSCLKFCCYFQPE